MDVDSIAIAFIHAEEKMRGQVGYSTLALARELLERGERIKKLEAERDAIKNELTHVTAQMKDEMLRRDRLTEEVVKLRAEAERLRQGLSRG